MQSGDAVCSPIIVAFCAVLELVAQGPLCPQRPSFVQVPIPDHLDLYHLSEEVAPTERTALETVTSISGSAVLDHIPCFVLLLNLFGCPVKV